jgi:hypothetical protein
MIAPSSVMTSPNQTQASVIVFHKTVRLGLYKPLIISQFLCRRQHLGNNLEHWLAQSPSSTSPKYLQLLLANAQTHYCNQYHDNSLTFESVVLYNCCDVTQTRFKYLRISNGFTEFITDGVLHQGWHTRRVVVRWIRPTTTRVTHVWLVFLQGGNNKNRSPLIMKNVCYLSEKVVVFLETTCWYLLNKDFIDSWQQIHRSSIVSTSRLLKYITQCIPWFMSIRDLH